MTRFTGIRSAAYMYFCRRRPFNASTHCLSTNEIILGQLYNSWWSPETILLVVTTQAAWWACRLSELL